MLVWGHYRLFQCYLPLNDSGPWKSGELRLTGVRVGIG